ncbi:thioredoxin domain-containing protein [Legionella jordanis]|uniref:Spermatogenesis-associated protein 20-like TRX domain-containing protein n=1 Tax=Legionella jordanis TaxID=456 RepID=A0A0W0V7Z2_9GAMM|nr:thioredoxin domain-containing protein [Legionella jordanis]KTD16251.1 hypothetical protein Ljor_0557 [Legionella jordanis]RMX04531.1 thioredoxin domain-containing protein [Legionella jordanis]RMX21079.1 thioredoxin domain-containing protein [Legionella jordanis]VEH12291.1 Thioredoxin-related protein [Legionella jordanis]
MPTANRLIHEHSPYLLQHAYNPVEWYPWGDEALEKAKLENKPILLSIGYAACHWCHVMAHESFENEETAALMNQLFINIKVDKEERPDLDKIYQTAHYYLSQQSGGWPLTIFLTSDLTPFFSGTYFPPEDRYQLPGFRKVLNVIAMLYKNQPHDLKKQGLELKRILQQEAKSSSDSLNETPLKLALNTLAQNFDSKHGGFGSAPKFPQASKLEFLLSYQSPLALSSLKKMAKGGLYDQLGAGFYRYSVDNQWMIPHFEKMLYDNGQLLTLYSLAAPEYPTNFFKTIIRDTADWAIREMQSEDGGFYSSLDADSEGEEGKFYRWDRKEIQSLLTPEEYAVASLMFGLTKTPNFEGFWHLYLNQSSQSIAKALSISIQSTHNLLRSARTKLFQARSTRIPPFRDDKILTSWNALMIKGMLLAARELKEDKYLDAAHKALSFIQSNLWNGQQLKACFKDGEAYLSAYLDDYAFLLDSLLASLQVSWNSEHLLFAIEIAEAALSQFADKNAGGFFFTAENHEELLFRPKPMMDDAIPSGNGILSRAILLLGYLLGENRYIEAAEKTLKTAWPSLCRYPAEHGSLLLALKEYLNPPKLIIIRGEESKIKLWQEVALTRPEHHCFAIAAHSLNLPQALATKYSQGDCCAYICQAENCLDVVTDLEQFRKLLA